MKEDLGTRIKRFRLELGLTQRQLGEELGVSAQAVSKWERAQTYPDVMTLPAMALLFGVTTDELLGCARMKIK